MGENAARRRDGHPGSAVVTGKEQSRLPQAEFEDFERNRDVIIGPDRIP